MQEWLTVLTCSITVDWLQIYLKEYNKYKNYFMKMKGVSRDGGTKSTQTRVVL